jgi:hypothetical protein
MTQDEIIALAAEIWNAGSSFPIPSSDDILHFAKLVAEAEREACAKLIEAEQGMNPDWQKHLAAKIRGQA